MRKVSYQPRPQVVQILRRYLLAGYDVELLSPRGNGGTRFLHEFLTEIREHGQAALLLPDVGEERPLPSALLAALTEQGRVAPSAALNSPAELAAALERTFGGRPLTLIVDGPQALPPLLHAAVTLYRMNASVQLVLRSERESLAPERSPQAVTVPLPLLTLEEMGAVLNGVCGAPLEAASLGRVYAKSAGLVKLAVAIAEIGMIEGHLKLIDGHWVAVRDLWSQRLLPMVRGYAQTEDPDDLSALETLAVAGLSSATEAAALIGEARLERLEQQQLVSVEPSGTRHWVTVNPPILGEMFRHENSSMRLVRMGAHIEEVTAKRWEAVDPPEREIRVAKIEPMFLRRVAERRATLLSDARHQWEHSPGAGTGLDYVEALIEFSAPAREVLAVIAAAAEEPASREQEAWFRIWEARVHGYQLGDLPRALRVLDRGGDLGEYRGLVVAARVRLCADLDVTPADAEAQLTAQDTAPLTVQIEMQRELVRTHYARGHLGLAEAAIAAVPVGDRRRPAEELRVYEALINLAQGRYERAMGLVTQGFAYAKDELRGPLMRSYAYVLHLLVLARGQGLGAARENEIFTALGEPPTFPQSGYLGIRVCGIVSVSGTVEEIHGMVKELESVRMPATPLPGTSRAWADAKLAAASGDPDRAAGLCWDDAIEMRRRGAYLAAAQSALRSLEHRFDEVRAGLVSDWLSDIDSEQLLATLDYLRARSHGGAEQLRAVIPRLAATGQVGQAMQAYRDLGRSPEVRNDPQLAASIAAEREEFSGTLENSGLDLLQVVASEAKLTRREEEVARLIAAGLTNRQIQEELVLSIRTVENHVHRLMRKLQVSTRQSVVETVRGWVGDVTRERV